MPNIPKLKFIENTANEGEGLSDAGIETYRDDPFPAVARETAQNSRDAHNGSYNPVRIEIRKITISRDELLGHESYLASAQNCLKAAQVDKNEKEISFFEQAVEILEADNISILEVADYNTKGLAGPCRQTPPTPFYALVKSSGSSVKEGQGAGGSFGIGKSAVYSASDLQTVFYSTIYKDTESGKTHFLCQGKSKFRSHSDSEENSYRSTGYWGEPNGFLPVEDPSAAPIWARRTEIGTSVFSIGMRQDPNWESKLIASIIVNFFGAIHEGRMVFCVGGKDITKDTLPSLFANEAIKNCALTEEDFNLSKTSLDCLTSADSVEETVEIENHGSCRVRILVREGYPKTVMFLRNGMKICTRLDHFGDKLAIFPLHKDFIAIVEPIDPNSSEWMRKLENPRHDELSPERLSKESDRRKAKSEGTALARKVRELLKNEAKSAQSNRSQIEELGKFFADDVPREEDTIGQRGLQTIKVSPSKPKKPKKPDKIPDPQSNGDDGGAATGNRHGAGDGNSSGDGSGEGSGISGKTATKRRFPIEGIRTKLINSDTPHHRIVYFTPQESGQAYLRFRSSGLSDTEDLKLANQTKHLQVECEAGFRMTLDVEFDSPYSGPIEVISWTEHPTQDAS